MGETQQPIVHTPGPWEAKLYSDGAFDVVNHDTPHHTCILAARNSYAARAGEMHANARLIASAPELLHACELLLMLSLPQDVSGMAMVEVARRTVRKAKGLD
jgi:hypothetical protein